MEEQNISQMPVAPVENQPKPEAKSPSFSMRPIIIITLLVAITLPIAVYFLGKNSANPAPKPTSFPTTTTFPTPVDETVNWKIYKNIEYSFLYPNAWSEVQENGLPTLIHQKENELWSIKLGEISQSQLNLRGATYCGIYIYPGDTSRCEMLHVNDTVSALIDWGTKDNKETQGNIEIPNSKGGLITMQLTPVNSETKAIVRQILSTFRFTNQVSPPPKGCPEDAKLCPDGSSVTRTGPNCEFAPCP